MYSLSAVKSHTFSFFFIARIYKCWLSQKNTHVNKICYETEKKILSEAMIFSRIKGISQGLDQVIVQGTGFPIPCKSCHLMVTYFNCSQESPALISPIYVSEPNLPTLENKNIYMETKTINTKFTWKAVLSLLHTNTSYHRSHLSWKHFVNPPSLPSI